MTSPKDALIWVWQLPQHLLGLLLIWLLRARLRHWPRNSDVTDLIDYWEFKLKGRVSRFLSGGSFGRYIILPSGKDRAQTVPHEYGHSVQSRAWGPLYLLVIGLPSALGNNLWDRLFHKGWPVEKRHDWYYSRYPEKQADKLGGVKRI